MCVKEKKIFLVDLFLGRFWPAWTKCRLVAKHILSITHFHSCVFLIFPYKYYFYKKCQLSNKNNLLLIYTFMAMIQFWRSIHLSFQSHQLWTFSAGLEMAWNRNGLSCFWNNKKYIPRIGLIWTKSKKIFSVGQ